MSSIVFSQMELNALKSVIDSLSSDNANLERLMSVYDKCSSAQTASLSALADIKQLVDLIKSKKNGLKRDEILELEGISLATLYRWLPKMKVIEPKITCADKVFYFEGNGVPRCLHVAYNSFGVKCLRQSDAWGKGVKKVDRLLKKHGVVTTAMLIKALNFKNGTRAWKFMEILKQVRPDIVSENGKYSYA